MSADQPASGLPGSVVEPRPELEPQPGGAPAPEPRSEPEARTELQPGELLPPAPRPESVDRGPTESFHPPEQPAHPPPPTLLPEPPVPARARGWSRVPVWPLAFLLLAAVAWFIPLRAAWRVPTEIEWAAAAAQVREGWQTGDLVRIEPSWAGQGATALQGLPELVLDERRQPERRFLVRYRRLWVLAVQGHSCDAAKLPDARLELRQALPRVEVCRFALPYRGEPLYDFRQRLADARVRREGGKQPEECRLWAKNSWHCGRIHPWKFVGPVVKDVDDNPREALWAHAPEGGLRLVIEYPAVPLGQELELFGGLTLRSIHSGEGSSVQFEVVIDGISMLRRKLGPTTKGWYDWSIATPRWAGRTVPVRFTVQARDNQVRQFLFDARTWERP